MEICACSTFKLDIMLWIVELASFFIKLMLVAYYVTNPLSLVFYLFRNITSFSFWNVLDVRRVS